MSPHSYTFVKGSQLPNERAQIVGHELAELEERYNSLTPKLVVNEARPEESVLHPCFEWDDAKAAETHREFQASHLIRSVAVVYPDPVTERPLSSRAFVNIVESGDDDTEETRRYVTTSRAMADPSMRRQLVERALRELEGAEKRYREFQELADIFAGARQRAGELLAATA